MTATGAYASVAEAYFDHPSGLWRQVIPTHPGKQKRPAVAGRHGQGQEPMSKRDVLQQVARCRGFKVNVGVVLPDGLLGIDVDAYGSKVGAATLAEREAEWGPLPSTLTTTARALPSGIRLFWVPEDEVWPGKVGADIEVVWWRNRYITVPPSQHHTRARYRWCRSGDGSEVCGAVPSAAEIAPLPPAWALGLAVSPTCRAHTEPVVDDTEARQLLWHMSRVVEERGVEGNRNNVLHWAACRCAEACLDEGLVRAVLGAVGESTGLAADEVDGVITSAFGPAHTVGAQGGAR